jgi:hypothetical protein
MAGFLATLVIGFHPKPSARADERSGDVGITLDADASQFFATHPSRARTGAATRRAAPRGPLLSGCESKPSRLQRVVPHGRYGDVSCELVFVTSCVEDGVAGAEQRPDSVEVVEQL